MLLRRGDAGAVAAGVRPTGGQGGLPLQHLTAGKPHITLQYYSLDCNKNIRRKQNTSKVGKSNTARPKNQAHSALRPKKVPAFSQRQYFHNTKMKIHDMIGSFQRKT